MASSALQASLPLALKPSTLSLRFDTIQSGGMPTTVSTTASVEKLPG
jgi:hypothetical protein